jgi:hypothetical protein
MGAMPQMANPRARNVANRAAPSIQKPSERLHRFGETEKASQSRPRQVLIPRLGVDHFLSFFPSTRFSAFYTSVKPLVCPHRLSLDTLVVARYE